jgi:hypothetical protein
MVSCASIALCTAVDDSGEALVSTDPTAATPIWTNMSIDSTDYLTGVSCASSALCVAVDSGGDAVVSTDPTSVTPTWTVAGIDGGSQSLRGGSLTGVSCPSASLCVAVDRVGNAVVTTDPTAATPTWTAASIDSGTQSVKGGSLTGVSCPSASLCVAVDRFGNAVVTTDPTAATPTWTAANIDSGTQSIKLASLTGVSCPSTSLCVAVDRRGDAVVSTDPTAATPTWTAAGVDGFNSLSGVACASSALCVAVDDSGDAVIGLTPAAPTVQIKQPADHETFVLNQAVRTSFSCVDSAGAPGLSACSDSDGAVGSVDTGTGASGAGTLDTSSTGTFTYTVTATSADGQSATASLSYTVVGLVPSQAALQFGTVDMHDRSAQQEIFSNQSGAPVTVLSSSITGADAADYSIQQGQDFCTGQTIPAYGNCRLTVVFLAVASRPGPENDATLTITDDTPASAEVPLSGTAQTGTLSTNTGSLDLGQQVVDQGGANPQPVTVTDNQVASAEVTDEQIFGPAQRPGPERAGSDGHPSPGQVRGRDARLRRFTDIHVEQRGRRAAAHPGCGPGRRIPRGVSG